MYKWLPEYCLKMPAIRFFAMLDAGRKLEAIARIEECDIAAIPACKSDYMKVVRGRFESVISHQEAVRETQASKARSIVVDAASQEAKDFMFSIFAAKKGLKT